MNIRLAATTDLSEILPIYAYAREFMRQTGNPTQWGNGTPAPALLEEDIRKKQLYVVEHDGALCGAFVFILGADPTYSRIEGKWLNDEPYGVIHRIAGNGTVKGILGLALTFGRQYTDNIRIDTHADNKVMQHLLDKYGFTRCGIIYIADGTPRIAYQKVY